MTLSNRYQYVVGDYYATGEGRTVCILITRAYPNAEQRDRSDSAKLIAAQQFIERFGSFIASGAENLQYEDFLKRFGHMLPEVIKKILRAGRDDTPGNFTWASEYHINFS